MYAENPMLADNALVKNAIEAAKQNLKNNEELLPTFFVGNDDHLEIVGAHFGPDPRDKDLAAMFVAKRAKEVSATYILFISEAWTILDQEAAKDFMNNRNKYTEVRLHPKAAEVVMFSLETATSTWFGRAPILKDREMGKIEWHRADGVEGRFANFLGQKPEVH